MNHNHAGFQPETHGQEGAMLRKVLWAALYGGLGALAAIVSRRTASVVWRTLTGEEPPAKR
jgi:hypothetical protein